MTETGMKMDNVTGKKDEMNAAGDLARILGMTEEERDTEIQLAQGALMELIDQLDKVVQNFTKMCQMYPVFKMTTGLIINVTHSGKVALNTVMGIGKNIHAGMKQLNEDIHD